MKRVEEGLGEWVLRYRWWVLAVATLMIFGTASGVQFLSFSSDGRQFFSKDNPRLKAFDELEATYTKSEGVLFVLAPKDGNVFTQETLAAVEELTHASWQIPYSNRVDSITNFQYTRADGDDLIVRDLAENATNLSPAELEHIKAVALSEPLLVNRLISKTGSVTGINVNVIKPGKMMNETPEIAQFARGMVADFTRNHPDIDIYLTGVTMLDNAFGESSEKDMGTLMPIMFFVLMVMMALLLRSFSGTLVTMIIIAASAMTGFGLAGWFGITISPPMANAPTIILTLAVADSIHILVTVFQQMRLGKSKHTAIAESLRVNFQPVFLTSVTTAIGFLAMNFSDAPPFHDLGNTVAMGVMAAFVYSIFLLPVLLSILPVRIKVGATAETNYADRLGTFVVEKRKQLYWGMLALVVTLTAMAPLNELDDVWIEYFDKSYDVRIANNFTEANLTGLDTIEYSLGAEGPGGVSDPEYLANVERFADWYGTQHGVVHVNTITDTFKRLNKNLHGDDEAYYRLPESRELAAQYLLLYEMSLPYGLDLNNQINVDKSSSRITVTLKGLSSKELRKIDETARFWLKANAPEKMFTHGASMAMNFAYISETNINSMLGGVVLALVLISGILMLALRSVKLGLLSLVPNLAPIFMAFGVWGIYVGQIGLGIAVIGTMTLGIVVDDTVHLLSKYMRARREHGMSSEDAVKYSFHTVGSALFITTIVLIAGFMVLTFSGFKLNSDLGFLTAIAIGLALLLDFLFLPTLLMKLDGEPEESADAAIHSGGKTIPAVVPVYKGDL